MCYTVQFICEHPCAAILRPDQIVSDLCLWMRKLTGNEQDIVEMRCIPIYGIVTISDDRVAVDFIRYQAELNILPFSVGYDVHVRAGIEPTGVEEIIARVALCIPMRELSFRILNFHTRSTQTHVEVGGLDVVITSSVGEKRSVGCRVNPGG